METLVCQHLVPENYRVVVTSRPEGVRLSVFSKNHFTLMTLLPLTDAQQSEMIHHQLHGNVFFKHLSKFSDIRSVHDRIFKTAFSESDRAEIGSFKIHNALKAADNSSNFDASVRQRIIGGTRFVAPIDGNPSSLTLQLLGSELCDVLNLSDDCDEGAVTRAIHNCASSMVASRLVQLLQNRRRDEIEALSTSRLWASIVSRTVSRGVAARARSDVETHTWLGIFAQNTGRNLRGYRADAATLLAFCRACRSAVRRCMQGCDCST